MELYPQFRLPTSPVSSQTDWLMMPYCVTTDSDGCYWLPTYRAQCVVGDGAPVWNPGSVQYRVEQDYSIEEDPETAWPLVSPTKWVFSRRGSHDLTFECMRHPALPIAPGQIPFWSEAQSFISPGIRIRVRIVIV